MPNIFLISDTHIGHVNMLRFKRLDGNPLRNFSSVQDMNETIIKNWNSVVSQNDIVVHMGDVAFDSKQGNEFMRRTNGKKRLLLGNHDHINRDLYKDMFSKFDKIDLWWKPKQFGINFVVTHLPMFYNFNTENGFKFNLHGHIHADVIDPDEKYYANLSVENINYTPKSIDEILLKYKK